MAIVAANPGEVVMDSATDETMASCFLHSNGLKRLGGVDMKFVSLTS